MVGLVRGRGRQPSCIAEKLRASDRAPVKGKGRVVTVNGDDLPCSVLPGWCRFCRHGYA